jgi:protein TonB
VIAGGFYAQILADSSQLPTPHRPIQFDASQFMPLSIREPPPPPVSRKARAGNETTPNAAPVLAPSGVAPETGIEGNSAPSVGLIAGVDGAPPSSIEGVGVSSAPAPPPTREPILPIRLRSGMKPPVKIVDAAPVYPPMARIAHVQGVVILEAVLDIHGRVESVSVLRSFPLLDQAAVDAVRQWRFTPALLNGEAVPVVMTVTVNFTLQDR